MIDHLYALEEQQFDAANLAHTESLFSLGNGRIGMRGHPVGRTPAHHPAVFINGFYETTTIPYGEDAYGFARTGQTMLDLPDCRYLSIIIDGEAVTPLDERMRSYRRVLDFKRGVLLQIGEWLTDGGKTFTIRWETLLSMDSPTYGMLRLSIEGEESAHLQLLSSIALPVHRHSETLDPRIASINSRRALRLVSSTFRDSPSQGFEAHFQTRRSALNLYCGSYHRYEGHATVHRTVDQQTLMPILEIASTTSSFVVEKLFFYESERNEERTHYRWDELAHLQGEHYRRFWERGDLTIEGDAELQHALRFNLFQLHQSVGRDGKTSLAAKGLTGLGYEGQYFWDTEIYAMPLFTHTDPQIARALITYRIMILDKARERAKELSQRGALFPWRTINGLEASAYFPASTAQYHINADIAHAIFQYKAITGDDELLYEGAFDVLIETARFWLDLGFYNEAKSGLFCINLVTGPDEYSALVDNNLYTNVMAASHLQQTAELARRLKTEDPQRYGRAARRLGLDDQELFDFEKAAEAMYIPWDEELSINPQDDRFLTLEEWVTAKRGEIKHPMLLNYHPLVIYRHRLIKQADTVLAMVLAEDRFPRWVRRRNFLFYEPLTTGDSSLSAAIQAIAAFDSGFVDLGMKYLSQTALMDISNIKHNTADGLHTAAMAGSWMTAIFGLAGYRFTKGVPRFRPNIPSTMERIAFTLQFGRVSLSVAIDRDSTTYRTDGGTLTVVHRSTEIEVNETGVSLPTAAHCKAIIFDLDGVLTSTDTYHYRAWKRLADQQGWTFDEEVNSQLRGVERLDSLRLILKHNNITLPEEEIEALAGQKNRWYRASLEALGPADLFDGITDLLAELRSRGLKLAIASASRNANFIVERLGLDTQVDWIVDASLVDKGKPDPEIFLRAAEALGVLPEECAGVEDARVGTIAIKEAGMFVVGVGDHIDPALCDRHVDYTADLRADMIVF